MCLQSAPEKYIMGAVLNRADLDSFWQKFLYSTSFPSFVNIHLSVQVF
jgi:hypothetical protein